MKRLLFFINIVLLGIIFFQACKPLTELQQSTTGARVGGCNLCGDYSAVPLNLLDADLARQMSVMYAGDDGKRLISNTGAASGIEDARSVWFNLETLKNFIWKLEKPLCDNGCTNMNLGLRIYYAKYPDDMTDPRLSSLSPSFAKRHTIFIVPTYFNGTQNVDFDPANMGTATCVPKTFREWFLDTLNPTRPPMILSVQNHGDLAPPPPGAGIFGN